MATSSDPDVAVTLDEQGNANFTYSPKSSGFNSYSFFQEIERLGGKIENAQWYMCG